MRRAAALTDRERDEGAIPVTVNENPSYHEGDEAPVYVAPTVEVISLDCEISSYAPDDSPERGDLPLF